MTVLITWCIALLAVSCYGQENAEVEVSLSRNGLNYAAGVAIDILTAKLQNFRFNDESNINNIRITQFNKPSANIRLDDGIGMTLSLDNAFLKIDADWKWEKKVWFIKIRNSGSVTASSGASITLSVKIGSQNGSPTINAYSCSASLPNLSFRVSGTWTSFIYNLLGALFKGKIRSLAESKLCETTRRIINEKGAQQLSTLPLKARVNEYLNISYSLPKPPYFSSNFLKSYHMGTFEGDSVTNQTPLMNTPTDKMIGISVSENVFNSACRVLYNKGVAMYTYTFDDWNKLTQAIPFLQDSVDGSFIVNIYASSVPTVTISSSVITINLSAVVDVVSKTSGRAEKNILHVKFQVTAAATAYLSSNILKGSVIDAQPQVQEITPAVPNVSVGEVNESLRGLMSLVVPQINERLGQGVVLPSVNGVVFEDSSLVLNDRYLSASADVRYIS